MKLRNYYRLSTRSVHSHSFIIKGDQYQYYIWVDGAYRFDNGVAIQIENKFEGWSLGKKINENIKIRVRDQKIEEII